MAIGTAPVVAGMTNDYMAINDHLRTFIFRIRMPES